MSHLITHASQPDRVFLVKPGKEIYDVNLNSPSQVRGLLDAVRDRFATVLGSPHPEVDALSVLADAKSHPDQPIQLP